MWNIFQFVRIGYTGLFIMAGFIALTGLIVVNLTQIKSSTNNILKLIGVISYTD